MLPPAHLEYLHKSGELFEPIYKMEKVDASEAAEVIKSEQLASKVQSFSRYCYLRNLILVLIWRTWEVACN